MEFIVGCRNGVGRESVEELYGVGNKRIGKSYVGGSYRVLDDYVW